jgi:hypothetical protein
MPKYVVSSTLKDLEWNNSTVLEGDLAEEVAKLKAEHDGDVVVHGSASLAEARRLGAAAGRSSSTGRRRGRGRPQAQRLASSPTASA